MLLLLVVVHQSVRPPRLFWFETLAVLHSGAAGAVAAVAAAVAAAAAWW